MATKYGIGYQKAYVNVPAEKIDAGNFASSVKVFAEEFVLTEALASGDVVHLFKMQNEGRIIDCSIKADDMGTAGAIKLGKVGADAGLIAAGDISDGSGNPIILKADADSVLLGEKLSVNDEIILTGIETTNATSGSIKVILLIAEV